MIIEPDGPVAAGRDLEKRYGNGAAVVHALRGVTVALAPRSFTAIMGPSGSGKSTLMHILAGLDRPSSGHAWLASRLMTDLDDGELTQLRRTRVGFVFQAFNLLPVLSAEENIVLPLRIAGEEIDAEWRERLLTVFELQDRRTHRPAELSGGEQQRVALARALMSRPTVVFADEPTGNLDSGSSDVVLRMFRRSVDELGQAVVMVTHDPTAAAHADRIVFLRDGQIVRESGRLSATQILDALKALR